MHRNEWTIYYGIPDATVNRFNEDFHSQFPEFIVYPENIGDLLIDAPSTKGNLFSAMDRNLD